MTITFGPELVRRVARVAPPIIDRNPGITVLRLALYVREVMEQEDGREYSDAECVAVRAAVVAWDNDDDLDTPSHTAAGWDHL